MARGTRPRWTRKEHLAVLYLKIEYGEELTLYHNLEVVMALARAMHRSIDSIYMRKANYDALDSSASGKGLSSTSRSTEEIWDEYQRNPSLVMREARRAYQDFVSGNAP